MPLTPIAVKEYTGLITQRNTDPPTVKILKNTLGNILWTRSAPGYYYGYLPGQLTNDKTEVIITPGGGFSDSPNSYQTVYAWHDSISPDYIQIVAEYNGQADDNNMNDCPIEIKVYQ